MLEKIRGLENKYLFNTYLRYPIHLVKGEGIWVYDSTGKRYCDLLSGISVCGLGHCHPEIVDVIKHQCSKLIHVSNLFFLEEQVELAHKLLDTCGLNRVFFCNSGAEANEAAIKLARRYFQKAKGEDKYKIITIDGSFHGRTLATLTATGQDKVKDGFGPLPFGFETIPFNDINALVKSIDKNTAGIMVEIIQGEGGVRPLTYDFLKEVQRICNKESILFMIDEIQTGIGRTGMFWSYQKFGLDPDIITTAKALGNGLPIGAMMAKEFLAEGFPPGSHGSTFGGGPLVCKVASRVLDIVKRDGLVEKADLLGGRLLQQLKELLKEFPSEIAEVRGRGLMIGIEMTNKERAEFYWMELLKNGFISNITQQKVIRLLPPLIIGEEALNSFVDAFHTILKKSISIKTGQ